MVEPIPDAVSLDLLMIISFDIFLIFTFDLTLLFLRVVINLELVSFAPRPLIVRVVEPFVSETLSSDNISVSPLDLMSVYLSSSYGKNTSLSPALIAGVELFEIDVLYCLLITISEPTRFTDSTFNLGKVLNNASFPAMLPDPEPPASLVEISSKF